MNRVSDFQCVSAGWRAQMETGRGKKAQCQSGQLGGNKAVVDGDAVDSPRTAKQASLSLKTHIKCMYKQNTHRAG